MELMAMVIIKANKIQSVTFRKMRRAFHWPFKIVL